jgi:hypothetical protein
MVEASDWLHCPFDSSTLPSEKTVRMRQQGKAVGCVSLAALLFRGELHPKARFGCAAVLHRPYRCSISAAACASNSSTTSWIASLAISILL